MNEGNLVQKFIWIAERSILLLIAIATFKLFEVLVSLWDIRICLLDLAILKVINFP